MIKNILALLAFLLENILYGSKKYYIWVISLGIISLCGYHALCWQLSIGLGLTGMSNQVCWGLYISNFTYTVGLAAGAVMLVIPAYIYHHKDIHKIVLFGELLAISAIVICLLLVNADMGRQERLFHIFPVIGMFNWPRSILAWDIIVLQGYLALNLYIASYLIYKKFTKTKPDPKRYLFAVYLSVFWAVSLHVVTAFLYNGLGAKPFWNSAIIAPRFLASAFVVGPAHIIITLSIIRKFAHVKLNFYDNARNFLRQVITISLSINLFFLISEVFTEFYTASAHVASVQYLFFGLHGHYLLVPFIWLGVLLNTSALGILFHPRLNKMEKYFNTACMFTIFGVWLEKGVGFIIPGFIPTPLGEVFEFVPTFVEITILTGSVTAGMLVYTLLVKATLPLLIDKVDIIDD